MAFDITKELARQLGADADAPRSIEAITDEVLHLRDSMGRGLIRLGECLIEAKAALAHGEWLSWLSEKVGFSERAAQNYMRVAREWSNPQAAGRGKMIFTYFIYLLGAATFSAAAASALLLVVDKLEGKI